MRDRTIPPGTVVKMKISLGVPAGSPAYVVRHEHALHLLTHGGGALVARHEVAVPRTPLDGFTPMRLYMPYGQWTEKDGAIVLFSRDYMPLWRLRPDAPPEPVAPWTWIEVREESWLWPGGRTPWGTPAVARDLERRLADWGVNTLPPLTRALPLLTGGQAEDLRDAVRALVPAGQPVPAHLG